jgi:transposase
MSLRQEFVELFQVDAANIRLLCRRFQISPKTGYKWLARYGASGETGLSDRSRRPQSSPAQTDAVRTARAGRTGGASDLGPAEAAGSLGPRRGEPTECDLEAPPPHRSSPHQTCRSRAWCVVDENPHRWVADSANWTTRLLAAYLSRTFGIAVSPETIRYALHRLS